MSSLTIAHTEIRQLDGLYSLNAIHGSSGNNEKHRPSKFLRNKQTQDLITQIEQTPNMGFALKTKAGGTGGSNTYACKELVYAYAMWISPKFNLMVIRAFDALQTGLQPSNAPQPQTLQTENTRLQAENQHLRQQTHALQDKYTDMLEYKVAQLEQQAQPKLKRQSKGPVTTEERKTIINMHLSGYSRGEIAKATNRSVSAVYTVIREYKAGEKA